MKTVQMVSIEKVRVINSRARSDVKFQEMVSNISKVGLKKPITISRRGDGDGYDLVCGQGRLEAYVALGQTEGPALVVDAPLHDRYLMSLVENLARPPRTTLQLAREIQTLKSRGFTITQIADKVGLSEKYVTNLTRLIQKGEERPAGGSGGARRDSHRRRDRNRRLERRAGPEEPDGSLRDRQAEGQGAPKG
jgi:ParB family chromosome partitioning protein